MDTGMLVMTALLGVATVGIAAITMDSEAKDIPRQRYLAKRGDATGDEAIRRQLALENDRYGALVARNRVPGYGDVTLDIKKKTDATDEIIAAYDASKAAPIFGDQRKLLEDARKIVEPVNILHSPLVNRMDSYVGRRADHVAGLPADRARAFHDDTVREAGELNNATRVKPSLDLSESYVYEKETQVKIDAVAADPKQAYKVIYDNYDAAFDDYKKAAHIRLFDAYASLQETVVAGLVASNTQDDIAAEQWQMLKTEAAKYGYVIPPNTIYDALFTKQGVIDKINYINAGFSMKDIIQAFRDVNGSLNRMHNAWVDIERTSLWINFVHDTRHSFQLMRLFSSPDSSDPVADLKWYCAFVNQKLKLKSLKITDDAPSSYQMIGTTHLNEVLRSPADKSSKMTLLLARTGGFVTKYPNFTLVLDTVFNELQGDWTAVKAIFDKIGNNTASKLERRIFPHAYADFRRKLPYVTAFPETKFPGHNAVADLAIKTLKVMYSTADLLTKHGFIHDWPRIKDDAKVVEWANVKDDIEQFVDFVNANEYAGVAEPDEYKYFGFKEYYAFAHLYKTWKDPATRNNVLADDRYCKIMYYPDAYLPGYTDAVLSPPAKQAITDLKAAIDTPATNWAMHYAVIPQGAAMDAAREQLGAKYRAILDQLVGLKVLQDRYTTIDRAIPAQVDAGLRTDAYSLFMERASRLNVNAAFFDPIASVNDMKAWVAQVALDAVNGAGGAGTPLEALNIKVKGLRRILKAVKTSYATLVDPADANVRDLVDSVKAVVNPGPPAPAAAPGAAPPVPPAPAPAAGTWAIIKTQGRDEFMDFVAKATVYAHLADPTLDPDFSNLLTRYTREAQQAIDVIENSATPFINKLGHVDLLMRPELCVSSHVKHEEAMTYGEWGDVQGLIDNCGTISKAYDAGEMDCLIDYTRYSQVYFKAARVIDDSDPATRDAEVGDANEWMANLNLDHIHTFV